MDKSKTEIQFFSWPLVVKDTKTQIIDLQTGLVLITLDQRSILLSVLFFFEKILKDVHLSLKKLRKRIWVNSENGIKIKSVRETWEDVM